MSTLDRSFKPALIEKIVRHVGTPVYIYSETEIERRYRALDRALGGRDHLICYAMKANSNRGVCGVLARLGAGADVVSGGELRRALDAGFAPRKIIFSGVGKTAEEIESALRAGVMALNVESEEELDAIARIARRLKRTAAVSVRVNPDIDAGTHDHVTTGRADNKFGVEPGAAVRLMKKAQRDPWLKPVGVQCHLGSQILRLEPYARALRMLLSLVDNLAAAGISVEFIDIGGGMGVSSGDGKGSRADFPLRDWAKRILGAMKSRADLRLLVEPGRFLVADAGILVTKVLYRKESRRARFVIVDAAMNDLIRPALYGAYHPIVPLRSGGAKRIKLDVVGPVCETADYLAKGRRLPWPEPGDFWIVEQVGAYGFSMSSQYNSRPRPAEAMLTGGRYRITRRRETFNDLVRLEQ